MPAIVVSDIAIDQAVMISCGKIPIVSAKLDPCRTPVSYCSEPLGEESRKLACRVDPCEERSARDQRRDSVCCIFSYQTSNCALDISHCKFEVRPVD